MQKAEITTETQSTLSKIMNKISVLSVSLW
jgi:hypothetical protein